MTEIFKTEEGRAAVHARYRELLAYWPAANEQLRLPTREGESFVIASGPVGAPALILLHGAQSNALSWMGDVAAWSEHFRVYAVDVIGDVGLSAPSQPALDTDGYALWLDDVLAGLGVERAALVGLSLGGFIALDYAIRRPEHVTALALLCPAGIGRQKNLLARAFPLLFLGPWGQRKLRAMVFGPTPKNPSPAMAAFGGFFAMIHQHAIPRRVQIPVASDAALAGLATPVMAVVGGKDVLIDSAGTRRRLESDNHARREVHFLARRLSPAAQPDGEGAGVPSASPMSPASMTDRVYDIGMACASLECDCGSGPALLAKAGGQRFRLHQRRLGTPGGAGRHPRRATGRRFLPPTYGPGRRSDPEVRQLPHPPGHRRRHLRLHQRERRPARFRQRIQSWPVTSGCWSFGRG